MNRLLSVLASATFMIGIVQYDALTNVYQRVQDGTIVPAVHDEYMNFKDNKFDQAGNDRNLEILRNQYSTAYLCASGKDKSKCKVADPKLNR